MREQTLLRLSLICSFLGLFSLAAMLYLAEPEDISISDIRTLPDQEHLQFQATVSKVMQFNRTAILEVQAIEQVKVVVFEEPGTGFRPRQKVRINGVIQTYGGSREIIATRITAFGQGEADTS